MLRQTAGALQWPKERRYSLSDNDIPALIPPPLQNMKKLFVVEFRAEMDLHSTLPTIKVAQWPPQEVGEPARRLQGS